MIGAHYATRDTLQWRLRWTNELLVMSETWGIISSKTCRDSVKIIMSSSSAGNIMSASYVTGQSSHLSTGISYSYVGRVIL